MTAKLRFKSRVDSLSSELEPRLRWALLLMADCPCDVTAGSSTRSAVLRTFTRPHKRARCDVFCKRAQQTWLLRHDPQTKHNAATQCRACIAQGVGTATEPAQPSRQTPTTLRENKAPLPVAHLAATTSAHDSVQPEAPQSASAGMQDPRTEVKQSPSRQRKSGVLKQMHLDFGQAC